MSNCDTCSLEVHLHSIKNSLGRRHSCSSAIRKTQDVRSTRLSTLLGVSGVQRLKQSIFCWGCLAARGGTLLFCVAEFISEIAMTPRPSEPEFRN